MNIDKITIGQDAPWDVNVIIEIPAGGPIKYELDKTSGGLFVDRFLHTAMVYPTNYGFIPHTLSADGDPVDALVLCRAAVTPGAVIRSRPIGVLMMEDEAGLDEKIVMVPVNKIDPYYANIKSWQDLPQLLQEQIAHFFEHYKDLEAKKWVKILGWESPEKAADLIKQAISAA